MYMYWHIIYFFSVRCPMLIGNGWTRTVSDNPGKMLAWWKNIARKSSYCQAYYHFDSSSCKDGDSTDIIEPRHDKTNKTSVRPAKTQISLGICSVWSESSLSTWRKLGPLAILRRHSEDSDQTRRMPRLIWVRWAHSHFVGFVMLRLIFWVNNTQK